MGFKQRQSIMPAIDPIVSAKLERNSAVVSQGAVSATDDTVWRSYKLTFWHEGTTAPAGPKFWRLRVSCRGRPRLPGAAASNDVVGGGL